MKEQTYSADYYREEDPKLFVSEKTGRGPLADNWLSEYWNEVMAKRKKNTEFISKTEIVDLLISRSKEKHNQHREICPLCVHINCVVSSFAIGACKRNWKNSFTILVGIVLFL